MAKKKHAKMAKTPARTQKSSSMGWVIAAIVVIVIIAFVVMKAGKQAPATTTKPTEQVAPKGTLTSATAPEFQSKCLNAIGVVPGTQKVENGVLSVTFKNNGRTSVEGTYFEFADASGTKRYKKNSDSIESGESLSYTVDLNQVGTELGAAVKTFILYPVEGGKACLNQRRQIISG